MPDTTVEITPTPNTNVTSIASRKPVVPAPVKQVSDQDIKDTYLGLQNSKNILASDYMPDVDDLNFIYKKICKAMSVLDALTNEKQH